MKLGSIAVPKTSKEGEKGVFFIKRSILIPYSRVSASQIMYNYSKSVYYLLVDHAKLY